MGYGLVAKQGDNYFAYWFGVTLESSTVIDINDKELIDGSWLRIAGSGETSQPEWNAPTSFGVFFANSNSRITKAIATDFKICLYHPDEQPTPSPSQSPSESYVKPDDTLFAIGENQHLIDSSKVANLLYPEPTTVNNSGDNILQFEVTDYGNLILKEDGSLWSGGDIIKTNEDPKYHPQNGFYKGEFYKVDDGIEYIRASNGAIYFKRVNDNKLYARPLSYHSYAQSAIGLENDNNTSLPEYPQVVIKDDDSPLENIVQISIEHKLTVFRTSDGKVYGAGQDDVQWNVFGLDSKPKTKATLLATEELDGNTISAVLANNGVLVLQDTGKLYRVGLVTHYARNLFPENKMHLDIVH